MWDECYVQYFEHSLAVFFFGIGIKTDLSQSCIQCWVFQACVHVECSTLTAPSFRIWSSSPGYPSLPLALFIVKLPRAHLTSHYRMSHSRWVITPSWLPRSLRHFLYSVLCVVYSCHLFLISSTSVSYVDTLSVLSCTHFCLKCSLGISTFLEAISSLSDSTVFLYFFALITGEVFLISPCCSLEFCIQMGISLLFSFVFHFSSFSCDL